MANRRSVQRACEVCGNTFRVFQCWLRNGGGRFCGRKCQAKGKRKRPVTMIEKTCAECEAIFSISKHESHGRNYCSRECGSRAKSRKMANENHPNWKGGVSDRSRGVRKTILSVVRKIGQCEECGSTENLQGHHIFGHADYPDRRCDPTNIQVLCAHHHSLKHPDIANMIARPRIRAGETKKCLICEKPFYASPHLIKTAKYCSHGCQRAALHNLTRLRFANGTLEKVGAYVSK